MTKMEMIEIVWNLDNKVKQLRLQIEVRGITAEKDILQEIEQEIKEVQLCLQEFLPEKFSNRIFRWVLSKPCIFFCKRE